MRAESIHLTLAFLGEVDDSRLSGLMDFPLHGEKHRLPLERVCHRRRAGIVWAEPLEPPAPLLDLASRLKDLLGRAQFPAEEREFRAHVTLVRNADRGNPLPSFGPLAWPVEQATLVRSRPAAGGSDYEVLRRWPLS